MFHSRTLNNRINRIHERALRLVYKDKNMTFDELLDEDNSVSIHHRNLRKLATEMYKVKNNLAPAFMKELFKEQLAGYNLRKHDSWLPSNIRTTQWGLETIAYRGPKIWEILPANIKESNNFNNFKENIRNWKPQGCKCRLCKTYIHDVGYI